MSKFLELINARIANRNMDIGLDPVPWELDDKKKAYEFVSSMGFAHPNFISHTNIDDIFNLAKSSKEFWKINDGRHIEVFAAYNSDYRDRFKRMLDSLVP